jgi:hypothetical protein
LRNYLIKLSLYYLELNTIKIYKKLNTTYLPLHFLVGFYGMRWDNMGKSGPTRLKTALGWQLAHKFAITPLGWGARAGQSGVLLEK